MAKRKNKSTEELNTEAISDLTGLDPQLSDEAQVKTNAVIEAAQELLALYASTHTITDVASYRYPGMAKLAQALELYQA